METIVGKNRPGSPSLKSTIPQGVVVALRLKPRDTIMWMIEARDGKIIATVEKVEDNG